MNSFAATSRNCCLGIMGWIEMIFRIFYFLRVAPPKWQSVHLHPVGEGYEPLLLVVRGDVRRVTLGSSQSGSADANSQYYY